MATKPQPDPRPDPPASDARSAAARTAARVLEIEAEAVAALAGRLDDRFDRALELLLGCKGRVVVCGMGKSGIVAQKIAATLSSTGCPALFMHPAEALHGDIGMLVAGDLLLALSNSGETDEIIRLVDLVRRLGIPIVSLCGSTSSTLADHSDVSLDVSVGREACSLDLAPTASTTAALAMGDALAVATYERRGFSRSDFARFHPGGRLGRKLLHVEALMHSGSDCPSVSESTTMTETLKEIDRGRLGMTCVVDDDGRLTGVITDGDLRRRMLHVAAPLEGAAREAMSRSPLTIPAEAIASEALHIMEDRKITSLPVVDGDQKPVGVIQIHDLWRTELF